MSGNGGAGLDSMEDETMGDGKEITRRANEEHPLGTVHDLIEAMDFCDRFLEDHYDGNGDKYGTGYEAYLLLTKRIYPLAGIEDLRAVADAEGVEFGHQWLKKQRGKLVVGGLSAAAVDALTVAEFARLVVSPDLENPTGQPDSKPDSRKKTSLRVPRNPEVSKLALYLKQNDRDGESMIGLARDYTDGNEKKAENLTAQIQKRFRHLVEGTSFEKEGES